MSVMVDIPALMGTQTMKGERNMYRSLQAICVALLVTQIPCIAIPNDEIPTYSGVRQDSNARQFCNIDSFCGFKFLTKRIGRPTSKPAQLPFGFSYVEPQRAEKVVLKKPFRKFKDALVRYDLNDELNTVELFRIMPQNASLADLTKEVDTVVATIEQKYGVKMRNLDSQMRSSTSSLTLSGYAVKNIVWREFVQNGVFMSVHIDVWSKRAPPAYQGHKPKITPYYVLTVRAHLMCGSKRLHPTPNVDAADVDAL